MIWEKRNKLQLQETVQQLQETVQLLQETVQLLQETVHSTLLLGCFYLLYMLYSNLSRVFCC